MVWQAIAAGVGSSLLGGILGSGARKGRQTGTTTTVANPFEFGTGLFSGSWKNGKGTVTLSPALQDVQDMLVGRAGSFYGYDNPSLLDFSQRLRAGFLGQLGSYNPEQAAGEMYNLLSPVLNRDFQRDYLNLENRLFAQGRLGSTGNLSGQSEMEALFRAQDAQQRQLLYDAYDKARQRQESLFNLGTKAGMLYPAEIEAYQRLGSGFLSPALEMNKAALDAVGMFGNLAGSTGRTTGTQYGGDWRYYLGAGLANAGAGLLNKGLGGLFSG